MMAARVLVDTLDTLRNPDGTLSEGSRKLALGALVAQLTESEIIDLRLRLNALRRPGLPGRLHAELHYKILDYIGLEDAMNLRLVHLDWCEKFSGVEFCKEVVKRHFPVKYEAYEAENNVFVQDEGERDLSRKQVVAEHDLKGWLERTMMYRMRRAHGQYESMSIFCQADVIEQSQYCKGRIAYRISGEMLVVKSLVSDFKKRFVAPQRDYLRAWRVSDQYILAVNGDGRTIYAWPLEAPESQLEDGSETQHFPSAISHFTCLGDRVGLVLSNNEIYTWNIGQRKNPTSKISYPSESGSYPKFHWRQLTVILHPSKKNVFFVCSERFNDTPDPKAPKTLRTRLRFYEYEDLEIKSRYTLYLNSNRSKSDSQAGPVIKTLHDNNIGISNLCGFRKRVSDKDSSIVQTDIQVDDSDVYLQDTVDEFGPMKGSERDNFLFAKERSLLLFDMNTKEFQCRNYHEPGEDFSQYLSHGPEAEALIWRNQTLSPIYRPDVNTNPPEGITDVLITAVNHFSTLPPQPTNKIYWYSDSSPRPSQTTTTQHTHPSPPSHNLPIAYHWIGPPDLARTGRLASTAPARHATWEAKEFNIRKVRGDDAFVVLFGRTGYVVWCFDPEVRLRVGGVSGEREGEIGNPFERPPEPSYRFCEEIHDPQEGKGKGKAGQGEGSST